SAFSWTVRYRTETSLRPRGCSPCTGRRPAVSRGRKGRAVIAFTGEGTGRPAVPGAESLGALPALPAVRPGPVGFAECYEQSYTALTRQVYGYTGDLALAQDLVQEAFCRALPRWSKISAYDDPVAWLRRVAF